MVTFREYTFSEVDSMARKQTRKATQAGRLGKDSSSQKRSPRPSGGAELKGAAPKKPSGLPGGYPTIPIREIKILRKGIRLSEDTPEEIQTLAEAIMMSGIPLPVVIDRHNYLRDGHRRLKAFRILKWDEVPYIRLPHNADADAVELQLNFLRKNLAAVEIANRLASDKRRKKLSVRGLAEKYQMSRSTVQDYLDLMKLPAHKKKQITQGRIGWTEAVKASRGDEGARRRVQNRLRQGQSGKRRKARKWKWIPQDSVPDGTRVRFCQEELEITVRVPIRGKDKHKLKKLPFPFTGDAWQRIMRAVESKLNDLPG